MAEKLPTHSSDSNPYRQSFGTNSNPLIDSHQPSEGNAALKNKKSKKVTSKSHKTYMPDALAPSNSNFHAFNPVNAMLSPNELADSSNPVSKSMMISFRPFDPEASSTGNSTEWQPNEICSSEISNKDLSVLVNTETLSNVNANHQRKNKLSVPKQWRNSSPPQVNPLQGAVIQSLKQISLFDMGITSNRKKKEAYHDKEKESRSSKRLSKLQPTGQMSQGHARRHQIPKSKLTKETEMPNMSRTYDNVSIMSLGNGLALDSRSFSQFNAPLVKTVSNPLPNQDDMRFSLEWANKSGFGQDDLANSRTVSWQSTAHCKRAKASRNRSDEMMIEDPADSKDMSHTFHSFNTQNTLMSTQCTYSQLDRAVGSNLNFSGLINSQFGESLDYPNANCFGTQLSQLSSGFSKGKITPKTEITWEKSSISKALSPNKKLNDLKPSLSLDSSAPRHNLTLSKYLPEIKNFSAAKTESTHIPGLDSTPPHLRLECEESPGLLLSSATKKGRPSDRFTLPDTYEEELKSHEDAQKEDTQMVEMSIEHLGPVPNLQEELAKFNSMTYSSGLDAEAIEFLVIREQDYTPNPYFLERKQRFITSQMRTILFDWLIEVSEEFALKRDTLYCSMNYIDRYLAEIENLPKIELQLIGLTALQLASKIEEITPPKTFEFSQAANYAYSIETIRASEIKMLKALKWILTPPTLNTWVQWYTKQWDLYTEKLFEHPLVLRHGSAIQFRKETEQSYALYREMMQLIDCASLDPETLSYNTRALTASFMYLTLGKACGALTLQQIYKEMTRSSLSLMSESTPFNTFFGDFISYCFEYTLMDLQPSIQYAATYFGLAMSYELPSTVKHNKEAVLDVIFTICDLLVYI